MFSRKPFVLAALLLVALLAACAAGQTAEPTTAPAAEETPMSETPAADDAAAAVTAAAVAQLAADLGLTEADVTVVSAEPTEFSDGCLGLGRPEESCLQAITPGWIVMLSANGQEYEVHTDETGTQARVAGDAASGDAGSDTASAAVQEFLAAEMGVALGDVQVLSAEKTEFTDGCLGLGGPEESCLQAITPGWLVTVSVNGQEYVAHTDETGTQVRIAPDAAAAPADPEAATSAAVAHLATELGVAETDITVAGLEAAEFSDGCLGLGGPEESCLQAITPGWVLTLSSGGQEYTVHTDAMGTQARTAE